MAARSGVQHLWILISAQHELEQLATFEPVAAAFVDRVDDDAIRGRHENTLGGAARLRGDFEAAGEHYERARQLLARALGEGHWRVAETVLNLGVVAFDEGRTDTAIDETERAIAMLARSLGEGHPDIGRAELNLGAMYDVDGYSDHALASHEHGLAILEDTLGPEHPQVGMVLLNLSVSLHAADELARALETNARALEIFERELGPEHPNVAVAWTYRGGIQLARGELAAALESYARATELIVTALPAEHPYASGLVADIGSSLLEYGHPEHARRLLERGLARLEGAARPEPVGLAKVRYELARASAQTGDPAGALELADSSIAGFDAGGDEERARVVRDWRRGRSAPPDGAP